MDGMNIQTPYDYIKAEQEFKFWIQDLNSIKKNIITFSKLLKFINRLLLTRSKKLGKKVRGGLKKHCLFSEFELRGRTDLFDTF